MQVTVIDPNFPGFFDLRTIGEPLRQHIKPGKKKALELVDSLTDDELKKQQDKGLYRKIYNARCSVVENFLAARPWLERTEIEQRVGTPGVCLHVDLLHDFVGELFTRSAVKFDSDAVARVRANANKLPRSAEEASTTESTDDESLEFIKNNVRYCTFGEHAGYVSIFDILEMITSLREPRSSWAQMKISREVHTEMVALEGGMAKRETPAADLDTITKIIKACSTTVNAARRKQIIRNLNALLNGASAPDENDADATTVRESDTSTQPPSVDHPSVLTRSQDGFVKWPAFRANIPEDSGFQFKSFVKTDSFKRIENDLAPGKAFVGAPANVTWIHPEVARALAVELDMCPDVRSTIESILPKTDQPPPCRIDCVVQEEPPSGTSYRQVLDSIQHVADTEEARNLGCVGFYSVYDLIALLTGQDRHGSSKTWARIVDEKNKRRDNVNIDHVREVRAGWDNFPKYQFPGQGQKRIPVAPFNELVKIVQCVRSRNADTVKQEIANIFTRQLAGDPNLVAENVANRASTSSEERRALVHNVPSAARVEDDIDIGSIANTVIEPMSPHVLALDGNDGARDHDPERIVHVNGCPFLRVENYEKDFAVPPGFGKRSVFYVNFVGHNLKSGSDIYMFGWSDDIANRMPQHVRTYGFPTSRPQILMDSGDTPAKRIEDVCKQVVGQYKMRFGQCTEVCDFGDGGEKVMLEIVQHILSLCSHVVEKSWIDPSLIRSVPKANTHSNDKPTSDDHLQIEKERTKRSEQDRQKALFELKRSMVKRGFSVDEIRSITS